MISLFLAQYLIVKKYNASDRVYNNDKRLSQAIQNEL